MATAKRKKRFFNVDLPLIGKTTQLRAYEIKDLDKKKIKYDLTRIYKGKSMMLTFDTEVQEDFVEVKPKELRLMPYYLRRMARKGTNYVEDSFLVESKETMVQIGRAHV